MANIEDYINYVKMYGGDIDKAYMYRSLLKQGKEIISEIETIQGKYAPNTSVENYNIEDKQMYEKLASELNVVETQQNNISFGIPPAYTEHGISVYKYKQAENKGQELLKEMEEIRFKYYPNSDIKNFSQEDKERFEQLDSELQNVVDIQKNLFFEVDNMFQNGRDIHLLDQRRNMIYKTSGQMPKITQLTLMDEYNFRDTMNETLKFAKIAVDMELKALEAGDYQRAEDCMKVCSNAYANFSAHEWGKGWNNELNRYMNQKLAEKHGEILNVKLQEYEALSANMSNNELKVKFMEFEQVSRICHSITEKKENVKAALEKIVTEKIKRLDEKLANAKENKELENNKTDKIAIQAEIEELETEWATIVEHSIEPIKSKHEKARKEEEEQARINAEKEAEEKKKEEQEKIRVEKEMEAKRKEEQKKAEKEAEEEYKKKNEEENSLIKSEEVDYLIEEFRSNNYGARCGKSVADIDTAVKNKIKHLEDEVEELSGWTYKAKNEQVDINMAEKTEQEQAREKNEQEIIKTIHQEVNSSLKKEFYSDTRMEQSNSSNNSSSYEEQFHEKIRPKEKSIKYQVGDEFADKPIQVQEEKQSKVDLWMSRFSGWANILDRVPQNVKSKFVKMKSDIVRAIRETIIDRNKEHKIEQNQEQRESR